MARETEYARELVLAIGERAKARRLELGLTLKQVASDMDRTYQCIYGMEQEGAGNIRLIAQWASVLKMSPIELAFGAQSNLARREKRYHAMLEEAASLIDARRGRRKALVKEIRAELGS